MQVKEATLYCWQLVY